MAELSSFTERQNEIAQLLQDRVHMMLTGGDPLTSVDVLRLTNVWQILNNRPDDDQASGIMISLDQEMDEYAD